jgi:hypothetical protein
MSKIAIYIDTSAFFDAKLSIVENLKKLLKRNRDIMLITNPVLTLEVDNMIAEEMKKPLGLNRKYFRERDIRKVERILLENKNKYREVVSEIFSLGKEVGINLTDKEIVDGCSKQYNNQAPWSDKKRNEWKDFFAQKSLMRYIENSENSELIILSRDKGFDHMKSEFIRVRNTSLKDFMEYVNSTKDERDGFNSYLVNKIYKDLEVGIEREIEKDFFETNGPLNDLEICIDDLKVVDASDVTRILCLSSISIQGIDSIYHTFDDGEEFHEDIPYSAEDLKYEIYISFDGEFDPEKLYKNGLDSILDKNVVSLIDVKHIS